MAKKQDKSAVDVPPAAFKHTMADPQFGRLVPPDFPDERDAIHIATAAITAVEDLEPGDHVGFVTKSQSEMGRSEIAPVGIVDPFLTKTVLKGEKFWVFLYPGTIASLRHNWSHPSFDVRQKLIQAIEVPPEVKRMKDFAKSLPANGHYDDKDNWIEDGGEIQYEEIIDRATAYVNGGEYWSEGGRFEGQGLYEGFWDDFEKITGLTVPTGERYSFFSCSC